MARQNPTNNKEFTGFIILIILILGALGLSFVVGPNSGVSGVQAAARPTSTPTADNDTVVVVTPTPASQSASSPTLQPTTDNDTVVVVMPTAASGQASSATGQPTNSSDTVVVVMPTAASQSTSSPTVQPATGNDTVVVVMPTAASGQASSATGQPTNANDTAVISMPGSEQDSITPTAIDPALVAEGEELFLRTAGGIGCQYCHGLDARGDVGPNIIGKSAAAINGAIGEVQMMEIMGGLTPHQIEAIAAYLATLVTGGDTGESIQPTADAVVIAMPTVAPAQTVATAPPSDSGTENHPEVTGDAANGEQLFTANTCFACHRVDSDETLVGPGLLTIAQRAGSRVSGLDAVAYVRQSIREPLAYVVDGFVPAMTPFDYLSDEDIDDIIAYLFSLDAQN